MLVSVSAHSLQEANRVLDRRLVDLGGTAKVEQVVGGIGDHEFRTGDGQQLISQPLIKTSPSARVSYARKFLRL
jgi:hypothetical protein